MIVLPINSVVHFPAADEGESDQSFAVLWISSDNSECYWIALNGKDSWPERFDPSAVCESLLLRSAQLLEPRVPLTRDLSDPSIERGKKLWDALGPALLCEPAVFHASERAAMIQQAARKVGATLNTVRSLFKRYWRNGKTPLAIYPNFMARGGRGQTRKPGVKKLGRPPTIDLFGANITGEMKQVASHIIRREARALGHVDLPHFYRRFCDAFFYEDGIDLAGNPVRVRRNPETHIPTLEAFRKFYYSNIDRFAIARSADPKRFDLNLRPLPGSATSETWGPGSRYLIDATMADIYLVSRINRSQIVGRPVIYIVQDVWSRLIVGVHVTIEDASWRSAMFALANAACSKVEYCRSLGIEISEDQWPAAGFGARLMSDHGEVDCETAENLVVYFNKIIEAPEAYRGDLKGLVETQFNTLQVQFGNFVPGYVDKKRDQRGRRDYRLDAVLDIHEFEQTIVDLILDRNSRILTRYDRDQGMPAGQVRCSPIELFHWGVANRSGRIALYPENYVKFHLMPVSSATIDRHGVRFKSCHYISERLLTSNAMSRAREGNSKSVKVSYLPGCVDTIFVHDAACEGGFDVLRLSDRSRAFRGASMAEVGLEVLEQKRAAARARPGELDRKINTEMRLQRRIEAAKAKVEQSDDLNASTVKHIRANRTAEQHSARAATSIHYLEGLAPESGKQPQSSEGDAEDFGESDLTDVIGTLFD